MSISHDSQAEIILLEVYAFIFLILISHTYPSHFGSMLLKYHCHSERNLYQIKRLTNPNQISKEMALFLP